MKKVISHDGSATLFNAQYSQTYHSVHGAVTESELVYLKNSGIRKRLEQGLDSHVLEIGFGLALNFLTTARYAIQTDAKLHYTAFENAPVSEELFHSLDYASLEGLGELAPTTAEIFRELNGNPQSSIAFNQQIHLDVFTNDALQMSVENNQFDAIYQDAFSPDANPELWSLSFLSRLFNALKPGGALTTYCVKGSVRRDFIEAGFTVEKRPGPPGKREILVCFR